MILLVSTKCTICAVQNASKLIYWLCIKIDIALNVLGLYGLNTSNMSVTLSSVHRNYLGTI